MENWLLEKLVCPRDWQSLTLTRGKLVCAAGHAYPVINGIPILLANEDNQTHWAIERALGYSTNDEALENLSNELKHNGAGVHPFVQVAVGATNGNLYGPLIGKLPRYPIPELRLPFGEQKTLLDVGCNWGRWTISAAQKGYCAIGLDPSLDAVLVARQVCLQLGVEAEFVVADARCLPFKSGIFDCVFSYSVLQHFSKENVKISLAEIARVMTPGALSMIQMPNKFGLRCLQQQARRRFREPEHFQVRYWTCSELETVFGSAIGKSQISVDGFFGLGIQPSDIDLLPMKFKFVVAASEILRKCSKRAGILKRVADSLYVISERRRDKSG